MREGAADKGESEQLVKDAGEKQLKEGYKQLIEEVRNNR